MYEITSAKLAHDNFHRGIFPATTDHGTVAEGSAIRKYAPIAVTENGLTEVTAETLESLVGIAADKPSGGEVVYYMTGNFSSEAVVLPDGVTLEELKAACRKLSIFLR